MSLQKLKVTELKELLAKHGLVQSGKKDELIQRLVDNGITGEADVPAVPATAAAPAAAPPVAAPVAADPIVVPAPDPAAPASAPTEAAPAPAAAAPETDAPAAEPEIELTEEQKKQKARAERFNMPWNPPKPKPAAQPKPAAAPAAPAAQDKLVREKAGAIDKSVSLGLTEEVLARRAAKWGPMPAKQASPTAPAAAAAPEPATKEEITPEMAAQLAADEEKKRKRMEKFAAVKPSNGDSTDDAPDAKKAKV